MYENLTYELLLRRMLDRVDDSVDKREGSVIYDALAPAAAEMAQMYIEADVILAETFADSATRDFLIKRAAERGIVPKSASKAVLKGVFNKDVPVGSRFSLEKLNYKAIEKIKDFEFRLECETPGNEGNLYIGTLIPVDYIDGLTSAVLDQVLVPGEDEEDTEQLRSRYFASLDSQAFGGNVTDYKEKVNKLNGVGGLKVYPAWNGGGTVKLVVIDSNYNKPSTDLIDGIQKIIDPKKDGNGVGTAPIGHVVTVVGVDEQKINIETKITYQEGKKWEDVQANVQDAVDDYFRELSKLWADSESIVVRISQIETRLLNVAGILDISDTTINDVEQNVILGKDSIPVRGGING